MGATLRIGAPGGLVRRSFRVPSSSAETFGELLREHRLAAGLTQQALAERAGLVSVGRLVKPGASSRGGLVASGSQPVQQSNHYGWRSSRVAEAAGTVADLARVFGPQIMEAQLRVPAHRLTQWCCPPLCDRCGTRRTETGARCSRSTLRLQPGAARRTDCRRCRSGSRDTNRHTTCCSTVLGAPAGCHAPPVRAGLATRGRLNVYPDHP